MKKILVAGVALLSLCAFSSSAFAQEDNNRDENGKVVRGPYETNKKFFDNTWVGVAGGISLFEHSVQKDGPVRVNGALDINLGKWFTPTIGARLGYQGLSLSSWRTESGWYSVSETAESNGYFKNKFNHAYVHGDLLWNISNFIGGYKETRTWNFIPYLTAGFARSWTSQMDDNEFAAGLGLLNDIRLTDRFNLTLDLRQLFISSAYDGTSRGHVAGLTTVAFGVAYKFGKTGFVRSNRAAYEQDIQDLKAMNEALENQKAEAVAAKDAAEEEAVALKDTVEALKNAPAKVEKVMLDVTPGAVFFEIGKTELSAQELFHLDFYLQNVIAQDEDKVFTLTGYADSQTGYKARNQQLSEMRVQYVYDLLKTKYGVSEDRLVVKAVGADVDRWNDPLLNRCVVIE